METLISSSAMGTIRELIDISTRDPKAELEMKVLGGLIQTKDVADRIVKAIESVTVGGPTEEHRATFSYMDGLRVNVYGPDQIHKVCTTSSFREIPLVVERKRRYFEAGLEVSELGGVIDRKSAEDTLDIPDLKLRMTLRHEEQLRKDFSGAPMDPANKIRILHRKSWKTVDGIFRIDMSLVKQKKKQHKSFSDILRQTPEYELEIELVNKKAPLADIVQSLIRNTEPLLSAFQQSAFLLLDSDMQRYRMEFADSKMRFVNPVTMERRHLMADRPHNILTGYTVTNKADGERCFLFVARDRRLLRVTKDAAKVAWTGLTATKDNHVGDVMDGEYMADRNTFFIFDAYHFRGKNVTRLPLMTNDDDVTKDPLKSRLGCAHLFVEDLRKDFTAIFSRQPLVVQTKMFLAGDGAVMEKAINTILDTKFEYPIDGLVFTPRASSVAPPADRKGNTWIRVYKWKPASQNSIDFLVRFKPTLSYDPVTERNVFKGTLYVSKTPGSDIVYPCETMTGEYKPPELPADLARLAEVRDRVPALFQPSAPKAPGAGEILIPVNGKNVPIDEEGQRIEDNTVIECARDVEKGRWTVMRTRYDKTYKYRVMGQPEFGNDSMVAESIWTNIHSPVTEEMIRMVHSNPTDDSIEEELYYRDEQEVRDRGMKDVRAFHNKIKEGLYQTTVKAGDTLLELAVGRGGDMHKWKKLKPSLVVGIDIHKTNLESPRQGACVRYLQESAKSRLPPALFIAADMTQSLLEQDNRYIKMLNREEPAPTPYLEKFVGLTEFDVISCQFAIHYACESEETFRSFVGNLTRHGKGFFIGTCMDGQAVYSLLLGKEGHTFRSDTQMFGEMTKDYADGDAWTEEFGRAINVKLESFETVQKEYLVPFGRVTEILKENGFQLVGSSLFSDDYAQQNQFTFTGAYQAFSFLHRGFVFKKTEAALPEEEVQTVTVPTTVEEPEAKTEEPAAEAPKAKPKRKTIKIKTASSEEPAPDPVFFFTGNPALTEFNVLGNQAEVPIQVEGITFPTVEHYYQWSKAKLFGDKEMETKILKTASPKSAKTYGKKVKDFKEEEWNGKKDDIMKTALRAKFTQNKEAQAKLLETHPRPIALADPRSKYWGIGTSSETSKAKDPTKWPGKNKLGQLLEALRAELRG